MGINIPENGKMEKNTVKGYTNFLLKMYMKAIGFMEREKVKEYTNGIMGKSIMETGRMIKCMDLVNLQDKMGLHFRVSLQMIWL